jgi:hypothetical protein
VFGILPIHDLARILPEFLNAGSPRYSRQSQEAHAPLQKAATSLIARVL